MSNQTTKFIEPAEAWRIRWDLVSRFLPEGPMIGEAIEVILKRLDMHAKRLDSLEKRIDAQERLNTVAASWPLNHPVYPEETT